MKSTVMTILLLTAVAAAGVQAQSAGNNQSASPAKKSGSTLDAGSTQSPAATGSSQSSGSTAGRGSKASGKRVNQRAAGVPLRTGALGNSSSTPTKKQ